MRRYVHANFIENRLFKKSIEIYFLKTKVKAFSFQICIHLFNIQWIQKIEIGPIE